MLLAYDFRVFLSALDHWRDWRSWWRCSGYAV